ncbi:MAG: DinB superfamily protein [Phycisphaerales bacterium]|nr:DinB superfamily protein [Phycisphaerales bacterium]
MSVAELFSKNILQTKGMIGMTLADFSDADMMARPVKTANHAIWQLGHLANSTRGMVTTCDPSIAFPYEDDPRFGKSKAAFDDAAFFPSKAELLARFDQAMDAAAAWASKLSDADLAKPTPEHFQNFAPTFGSVAILLGSHPYMHLGQFQVTRRALGKPHLM